MLHFLRELQKGAAVAPQNLSFIVFFLLKTLSCLGADPLFSGKVDFEKVASEVRTFAQIREPYYKLQLGDSLTEAYMAAGKHWEKTLEENKGLEAAYNHLHIGYLYSGVIDLNPGKALKHFQEAEKLFTALNKPRGVADALNGMATAYFYSKEYFLSIEMAYKALWMCRDIDYVQGDGYVNNNIGSIYVSQEFVMASLRHYYYALESFGKINQKLPIAATKQKIGLMYIELNQFCKGKAYLDSALVLYEEINRPAYLKSIYEDYTKLRGHCNSDETIMAYLKKSYILKLGADIDSSLDETCVKIGQEFQEKQLYDSANLYYQKAERLAESYGDTNAMSQALLGLGAIAKAKGTVAKALFLTEKACVHIDKQKEINTVSKALGQLADLYTLNNKISDANKVLRRQNALKDSLLISHKTWIIKRQYFFAQLINYEDNLNRSRDEQLEGVGGKYQKERAARIYLLILSITLVAIIFLISQLYIFKRREHYRLASKNTIIDRQNKQLEQKNEQLQASQKVLHELNTTKDRFFSIIAHDLRNPLNSMMKFSELMEQDLQQQGGGGTMKYVRLVKKTTKDLYGLLENLLQWSRSQTGIMPFSPRKHYLIDVVNPVVSLLEPQLQAKELAVHLNIEPDQVVYADHFMLTTVFRNLIGNAIKYTPQGRNIFIGASTIKGQTVKVFVKDEGIGLTAENQTKVFALNISFTQLGTEGETGSGLGLLLCKEFIEKNKGKIGVESKESEGATFWFELPLKE